MAYASIMRAGRDLGLLPRSSRAPHGLALMCSTISSHTFDRSAAE